MTTRAVTLVPAGEAIFFAEFTYQLGNAFVIRGGNKSAGFETASVLVHKGRELSLEKRKENGCRARLEE